MAGPYVVPIVLVGLAALLSHLLLRPDPFALAYEEHAPREPGVRACLRQGDPAPTGRVLAAVAALVAAQATMVLIMTMHPAPPRRPRPRPRAPSASVISGHVFGMFALAPISGWIVAAGRQAVRRSSSGRPCSSSRRCWPASRHRSASSSCSSPCSCWAGAGTWASSPAARCCRSTVEPAERARIQGVADAVIWTTSAMASLGSGVVVAAAGFSSLGFLGVALVLAPVWLLLSRRRAIAETTAT